MSVEAGLAPRPSAAARTDAASAPLLSVEGLGIAFGPRRGFGGVRVTEGVDFQIARGERVGLVGESGCGKTVTGLALMRLLPPSARIDGRVMLDGENLLTASASRMRRMRGAKIAMIFQEPMTALDPVFTIGEQIGEALRIHKTVSKAEEKERVIEALAEVGIPAPARRAQEYPHQLSGGMRQRAMIAMALVCRPELIIADEPTTALDVTIQAQIMDLLARLSEETGTALLFITHDLGVVAETCTRMITMYAGQVVEDAPVDEALMRPRHPYTSGLLRSLPQLNRGLDEDGRRSFAFIPGRVPSPMAMPEGCRFRDRCAYAEAGCERPQVLDDVAPGRRARCRRTSELTLPGAVD
ncbi:ABC transporter ATP-binding protein [Albimonas sp. CAU 1670]|uniref:ABC transporter ATP-binding protein n=1 Tax=Albimonas sp. CAU 1670 TaxID=3032599 RepID=UPI0023DAA151|nr:ABC transporter ATP-binding protein [Albimonas sp. CAU 1670]MDF2233636.1 ABC transporter ATP-binding protein [Albimonas sp. CAU 1670]